MTTADVDDETLHRAVDSRDPRFDGRVYLGVTSTGIYCRPSCPARRPRRENRRFYASSAAAVAAGFRACKLCRPESLPGSRAWDHRGTWRRGRCGSSAPGTSTSTGSPAWPRPFTSASASCTASSSPRWGPGALRLARSRRAQTARLLIDQTSLPLTEIAFAAGFASVRQFNDVMREEFGVAPSALRRREAPRRRPLAPADGSLVLRLRLREPYAGDRAGPLVRRARGEPGWRRPVDGGFAHVLRTPHGPAVARLHPEAGHLVARLSLPDLTDLAGTVAGLRRLWDLDTDPAAVDGALAEDAVLAPLVALRPGLRVPGATDGFEVAARAVLGQQVSVAAARTFTARLVERLGEPLAAPAAASPRRSRPPRRWPVATSTGWASWAARVRALRGLAGAVADGLRIDAGADRDDVRAALLALPGIGPWTADYVALRALGDPDAWLPTDLILRRSVERRHADPERWRPWRAYAAVHLWTHDALEAS